MKKRNLIALLMAVCMMFSLLPVNAIAVGDEGTIPAEETLLSENGNDPAPAGSTNPAGDKDSIPGTGEKPSAAEEPVKDEESAKDEEPGKDEEPAEDEEGGKTNVVPMRVVRPDTDKYLTYVFRVDGAEVSRQIVKKGDTLYQPVSPVKDGYKFTGWFVGASELACWFAQRVVRNVCPRVREPYDPPRALLRLFGIKDGERAAFRRGKGCYHCGNTGYLGRIGIFEVMPVTPEIQEAIVRRAHAQEISAIAQRQGVMNTLAQDAAHKIRAGITTVEEEIGRAHV